MKGFNYILLLPFLLALASAEKLVIFRFDMEAAGVTGVITFNYSDQRSPHAAQIVTDLDFTRLNTRAIGEQNSECSNFDEFSWHIHTKWGNKKTSGFLQQCSAAQTGGHYDPYFACSPASQHHNHFYCKLKKKFGKGYQCSIDNRTECEVGDLSGRHGPVRDKKMTVFDHFLPTYNEISSETSIVLHAKCAGSNRISCAQAQKP